MIARGKYQLGIVFLGISCFGSAQLHAVERPNILIAVADDWGLHAGVYGTTWVKTPAFDKIAQEGLLFKNAYTPMAKCAPSLAILLTGRHLWQIEEAGNHLAFFPTKLKTWPEVLAEKGWAMGFTGKGWGPGRGKWLVAAIILWLVKNVPTSEDQTTGGIRFGAS